jgi:hypothetical protein
LMVVCILTFLLFYYIYKLLTPGLTAWRRSEVKVTLQQNTVIGMYRLKKEIEESNVYTVTVRHCDLAIEKISDLVCFASARDKNGTLRTRFVTYTGRTGFDSGAPDWQKYIIYYHDYKSRLRRMETPDYVSFREAQGMRIRCDPTTLIHVDDTSLDSVVTRKIERFAVAFDPPTADEWKGGLYVSLVAFNPDPNPVEEFRTTLETTMVVRYDDLD